MVTKQVRELDPDACQDLKSRSLILTSEAWKVIRGDIQSNCMQEQCAQLTGKLDEIFLTIDKGLELMRCNRCIRWVWRLSFIHSTDASIFEQSAEAAFSARIRTA